MKLMTLILSLQSLRSRWEDSHINTFNTRSQNPKCCHITGSDKELPASEEYVSWANQNALLQKVGISAKP